MYFLVMLQEAEDSLRFYRNATRLTYVETESFKSEREKLRTSDQTLKRTIADTAISWSDFSEKQLNKSMMTVK